MDLFAILLCVAVADADDAWLGKIKNWMLFRNLVYGHGIIVQLCRYAGMVIQAVSLPVFFFLIYLGYLWVAKGIVLNRWTGILSGASMTFILLFAYANINMEPWLDIIGNIYLTTILRVLLAIALSIIPVLLYKRYKAANGTINV